MVIADAIPLVDKASTNAHRIGIIIFAVRLLARESSTNEMNALSALRALPMAQGTLELQRPVFTKRNFYLDRFADDALDCVPAWPLASSKRGPLIECVLELVHHPSMEKEREREKERVAAAAAAAVGVGGGGAAGGGATTKRRRVDDVRVGAGGGGVTGIGAFATATTAVITDFEGTQAVYGITTTAAAGGGGGGGGGAPPADPATISAAAALASRILRSHETATETVKRIKESLPSTLPILSYPVAFRPPYSVPAYTTPTLAEVIVSEALTASRGGRIRRRDALGGLPDAGDGAREGAATSGMDRVSDTELLESANKAGVREEGLRAASSTSSQTPLVGRLCAVGRLIWFGKTRVNQQIPVCFKFRLSDASRFVDVMVWNGGALNWHRLLSSLSLGSLIGVINYRVKVWNGAAEISLQATGPDGLVVKLHEASLHLFPSLALPRPLLRLTSEARAVFEAPEGRSLSFVGIVQRLGPLCRTLIYDADLLDGRPPRRGGSGGDGGEVTVGVEVGADADADAGAGAGALEPSLPLPMPISSQIAGSAPTRGRWQVYRWVWLLGQYSERAVLVKLFSNSAFKILRDHEALAPGAVVAVLNARVMGAGSVHGTMFLTSCEWTQVLVDEPVSGGGISRLASLAIDSPHGLDIDSAASVRDILAWRAAAIASGDFGRTFALSPCARALRCKLAPSVFSPLSSLARPPTLNSYVGLMVKGFIGGGTNYSSSSTTAAAESGGGAAATAAIVATARAGGVNNIDDGAHEGNPLGVPLPLTPPPLPLIHVTDLIKLVTGYVECATAITNANITSPLGIWSRAPDVPLPEILPTRVTSLTRKFPLLAHAQLIRVIVRARIAAIRHITSDSQSTIPLIIDGIPISPNDIISADDILKKLHEEIRVPEDDDDDGNTYFPSADIIRTLSSGSGSGGGGLVTGKSLLAIVLEDINDIQTTTTTTTVPQPTQFLVLLHPSSLFPHVPPLPPLTPDYATTSTSALALSALREAFPSTAPADSITSLITWATAPGREFAVCMTVHARLRRGTNVDVAVPLTQNNIEGPIATDGSHTFLRTLPGARHPTVRIEAMYDFTQEN